MIEAYTIGIRLALDDGVSARVRAIRDDMATIDDAVASSGMRIRDLARIGRGLVVPEESLRVGSNRENVAPIPDERAIARAGGRQSAPSGDNDGIGDGALSALGDQAKSPVASEASIALVPRLPSLPGVSVAPREESPPVQPAIRASQADSIPDMSRRLVPDEHLTNLAELGRAISSRGNSLPATSVGGPVAQIAHGSPGEPKPVAQPLPVTSTPHELLAEPRAIAPAMPEARPTAHAFDIGSVAPPTAAAVPGSSVAAPVAPPWRLAISAAEPARQMGSIAPAAIAGSVPGLRSPAPGASRDVAKPSEGKSAASQEPAHGELVIDGSAIGRWISDHLADRVVRPHSGFSGMDPRLSPAWPGVVSNG